MKNYMKLELAAIGENESFARSAVAAFALCLNPSLAELSDIKTAVSEAVTDAYASIHKLRSADAFKAWIFRILSNKCKDRLKEYTRKHVNLEDVEADGYHEEELAESLHVR